MLPLVWAVVRGGFHIIVVLVILNILINFQNLKIHGLSVRGIPTQEGREITQKGNDFFSQ